MTDNPSDPYNQFKSSQQSSTYEKCVQDLASIANDKVSNNSSQIFLNTSRFQSDNNEGINDNHFSKNEFNINNYSFSQNDFIGDFEVGPLFTFNDLIIKGNHEKPVNLVEQIKHNEQTKIIFNKLNKKEEIQQEKIQDKNQNKILDTSEIKENKKSNSVVKLCLIKDKLNNSHCRNKKDNTINNIEKGVSLSLSQIVENKDEINEQKKDEIKEKENVEKKEDKKEEKKEIENNDYKKKKKNEYILLNQDINKIMELKMNEDKINMDFQKDNNEKEEKKKIEEEINIENKESEQSLENNDEDISMKNILINDTSMNVDENHDIKESQKILEKQEKSHDVEKIKNEENKKSEEKAKTKKLEKMKSKTFEIKEEMKKDDIKADEIKQEKKEADFNDQNKNMLVEEKNKIVGPYNKEIDEITELNKINSNKSVITNKSEILISVTENVYFENKIIVNSYEKDNSALNYINKIYSQENIPKINNISFPETEIIKDPFITENDLKIEKQNEKKEDQIFQDNKEFIDVNNYN